MTTLMLVALSSISWLIEGNVLKGLAITCIGILVATIGISTNTGEARYTFGVVHLLSGVNFIPLVVGFIGMAQVFNLVTQEERENELVVKKLGIKDCKLEKEDISRIKSPRYPRWNPWFCHWLYSRCWSYNGIYCELYDSEKVKK